MSPAPAPLTILLADDHAVLRHGAKLLLDAHPGWQVVGEAANGREAVALAEELRPQVAILDLQMPEMNGLETVRRLKRSLPRCEIVIFSGVTSSERMHEILAAGARSYVLKGDTAGHLVAAVEAATRGKPYFSEGASQILFARILARAEPAAKAPAGAAQLSEAERETLTLLAQGRTNKEVAAQLSLSIKAIEKRRALLMRKLGLETYSELVRFALREGLIGELDRPRVGAGARSWHGGR